MENKTEIEIVNEKVSDAIKSLTQKRSEDDVIVTNIQKHQSNFYHFQNMHKLINCQQIRSDEDVFNYLKSNFKEGILKEIMLSYIPSEKDKLKKHIDRQIERLKK